MLGSMFPSVAAPPLLESQGVLLDPGRPYTALLACSKATKQDLDDSPLLWFLSTHKVNPSPWVQILQTKYREESQINLHGHQAGTGSFKSGRPMVSFINLPCPSWTQDLYQGSWCRYKTQDLGTDIIMSLRSCKVCVPFINAVSFDFFSLGGRYSGITFHSSSEVQSLSVSTNLSPHDAVPGPTDVSLVPLWLQVRAF